MCSPQTSHHWTSVLPPSGGTLSVSSSRSSNETAAGSSAAHRLGHHGAHLAEFTTQEVQGVPLRNLDPRSKCARNL